MSNEHAEPNNPPPADETADHAALSPTRRKNVVRIALSDEAMAVCRVAKIEPQQLVDRGVHAEVARIEGLVAAAMKGIG